MRVQLFNIVVCIAFSFPWPESLGVMEGVYFGKWVQNSEDEHASFHTFEWMVKSSIKDCVDACKRTKACEHINYEVRSHKCALIRSKYDQSNIDAEVKTRLNYIYGNKSEWRTNLYSDCDKCPDEGKCLIGSTCRNSGCGMPRSIPFHGNILSPGSRIRKYDSDGHEHSLNATIATCAENGTWLGDQHQHCEWSFFNESYYCIQSDLMSWFEAKAFCESLSGHLVDINSEEEQKFLERLLVGVNGKFIWTGGNNLNAVGDWRWTDDSMMSGFTNWGVNSPSNTGEIELCMEMVQKHKKHSWNDTLCLKLSKSICEN